MPTSLAMASQTLIGGKVAKLAEAQVGIPYLYGGDTPKGFDCSGLVYYVYTQAGIWVPRSAEQQFDRGPQVSRKALQAGDLVFFRSDSGNLMHVGIYIGSGWFVHAPESGKPVAGARLDSAYWTQRYLGAARPGG
jgi:cell wall-associated NlpC family hydrolase